MLARPVPAPCHHGAMSRAGLATASWGGTSFACHWDALLCYLAGWNSLFLDAQVEGLGKHLHHLDWLRQTEVLQQPLEFVISYSLHSRSSSYCASGPWTIAKGCDSCQEAICSNSSILEVHQFSTEQGLVKESLESRLWSVPDKSRRAPPNTAFLSPSSVAVIGASRARMTIGGEIFHSLLATASKTRLSGEPGGRPCPLNRVTVSRGACWDPKLGQAADQDGRQTDAS